MDHPARKATFDIEMEVGRGLAAVANTEIKAQEVLRGGRKRVIFETTPPMSTYLVFFGVGEFERLQDPADGRLRVLTLPGSHKHASFGLEFGRQALQFSEAYYGIPYPLSKLDLIAVPDFAFGAMENWGAITFRENLLLHYPGITSRSGEERICEVIAHEIAHQWFGNLVTPSDWKYLWLNESFATYFGYGVVAHFSPQWGIWQQFLNGLARKLPHRDSRRRAPRHQHQHRPDHLQQGRQHPETSRGVHRTGEFQAGTAALPQDPRLPDRREHASVGSLRRRLRPAGLRHDAKLG
jgi:tricorn protease interacting factor F2/3